MTHPNPTTSEEILRMIEAVDPSDAAKMDEIDARFWCFKNDHEYLDGNGRLYRAKDEIGQIHLYTMQPADRVSSSRDALKAIRPEGWVFDHYDDRLDNGFRTVASKRHAPCLKSGLRKTEELAELHAIIQAIAHERGAA